MQKFAMYNIGHLALILNYCNVFLCVIYCAYYNEKEGTYRYGVYCIAVA